MWYTLDENNKPLVSTSIIEAAEWLENNPERKAVKQEHIGDIFISTVFLGLDHSWNSDVPVLWETMIFGGPNDQEYQERYTSYEDAVEGHKVAVQIAINSLKTEDNGNTE